MEEIVLSVERSEAVRSSDLLDDLEARLPKVVDQLHVNGSPPSVSERERKKRERERGALGWVTILGLAS